MQNKKVLRRTSKFKLAKIATVNSHAVCRYVDELHTLCSMYSNVFMLVKISTRVTPHVAVTHLHLHAIPFNMTPPLTHQSHTVKLFIPYSDATHSIATRV